MSLSLITLTRLNFNSALKSCFTHEIFGEFRLSEAAFLIKFKSQMLQINSGASGVSA